MGNTWAALKTTYPPKSKFSTDQVPDLTGRVVIVTGGNGGLGKELVKALLEHNAKVYMAARSKERAEASIADLKDSTGREAIFLELDLSSLASVRAAAEAFLRQETELHILFNNAGVMAPPVEMLSADGYDLQFGTNIIGPFLLTKLLMPALLAGKETSPDHHARVITTSSVAAYLATLNFDTLRDGPVRRKMLTATLYSQSKFATVVVARELAKRYADKGIVSISLHPGNLKTDVHRHAHAVARWLSITLTAYPVQYGTLTLLWAATMPETLNYNGMFMIPWARVGRCREEAYDDELGKRLWAWLEEEVKDK